MSDQQWLSTEFPKEMIHALPVTIKRKMGFEVNGNLNVEDVNKEGEMIVSVNYNSNPFEGSVQLSKFFLTQEQLKDFTEKGARCLLIEPEKILSGI